MLLVHAQTLVELLMLMLILRLWLLLLFDEGHEFLFLHSAGFVLGHQIRVLVGRPATRAWLCRVQRRRQKR